MQDLELSTSNILALFETTKEQRQSFVNDLIERLQEGIADPLKAQIQIKCMEDIINQLTCTDKSKNKNVQAAFTYRNLLLETAQKYGAKSFDYNNARIEIKETGSSYHYSQCNDFELPKLEAKFLEAKKALDERKEFLKTVPARGVIVTDESSGETVTVYPPSKSSTTSVTVRLK